MAQEPSNIKDRSFAFGVRILKLVRALPRDVAGQIIGRQLVRSGTSVGANVEEAQGAESRRDFAHKLGIARKEARETLYWLRLVAATEALPAIRLRYIMAEAEEIMRILTASVRTLQTSTVAPTIRERPDDNHVVGIGRARSRVRNRRTSEGAKGALPTLRTQNS
jgi:four helix bundle protein